jgi:hypothetical protein
MGKSYKYKGLSFAVADDTDVNFTVEFISDGNTGKTVISADGKEIQITDSGTKFIGKGKSLRSEIICVSNMANLNSHEDEIRIHYKINGQLLVEHVNLKSDEARPLIYLFITFTAS